MEAAAEIFDWEVCGDGDSDERGSPESHLPNLRGYVRGHARHKDGSMIRTSSVKGRVGSLVLTVSGGLYRLGDPESGYEDEYPDARQRFLKREECVVLAGTCPHECDCCRREFRRCAYSVRSELSDSTSPD